MKHQNSLFRNFMTGHFIFIILPMFFIFLFLGFVGISVINENHVEVNRFYMILLLFAFIIVAFVIMSWIFFLKLRKRLIRLQESMAISADNETFPKPVPIQTDRMDEIDQLGNSFNWMISQLEDSKIREYEEELLRRNLIANLSHDLRTPLTILRGHVSRLHKESLSIEGKESIVEIDHTITRVDDLMDDLLAYTLLTSGKYPFQPSSTDIIRLVRASVAAWYPVFEEKKIQFDVDLPTEETFYWEVDSKWVTRVLDNLFQNILRHAATGKYASIVVDDKKEQIIILDKGPGMDQSSDKSGVGIGLSISNYMLEKMKLKAQFLTNENGTKVVISRA
ncbi:histidine kinase dimerization/phospho-acceptor domain-containing protein [Ornithinibacillus sp. 4-3]|uniref:histidine kinase n=1 Tax=Ornithinibacillus sp. 4-3 TaxID=3231488 RepID=A0AB39HPW2_9BACI